jgi:hypothetical protein
MNDTESDCKVLKDGKWVAATPHPYYKDTRPVRVKIGHTLLALRGIFISDIKKRYEYFDKLELRIDKWLVPDPNGNWFKRSEFWKKNG